MCAPLLEAVRSRELSSLRILSWFVINHIWCIRNEVVCNLILVHYRGMADEAQLKVRLLRSLKAKVDAAAFESRRTLNAEIVARLERTFVEDDERAKAVEQTEVAVKPDRIAVIETRLDALEAGDGADVIAAPSRQGMQFISHAKQLSASASEHRLNALAEEVESLRAEVSELAMIVKQKTPN